MNIKATKEQVVAAACKAIAASRPDPTEAQEHFDGWGCDIDYFHGRMVKFSMKQLDDHTWQAADNITPDYQSWCRTYPSYQALFADQ